MAWEWNFRVHLTDATSPLGEVEQPKTQLVTWAESRLLYSSLSTVGLAWLSPGLRVVLLLSQPEEVPVSQPEKIPNSSNPDLLLP